MNDIPIDIPPGLRYHHARVMMASARHTSHHDRTHHEVLLARAVVKPHSERGAKLVEVAMVLPPPEPPRHPPHAEEHGHRPGLHLIDEAQAAENTGRHHGGSGWAVQVGAYGNQAMAQRAAGTAKAAVHVTVSRVDVQGVHEKHGKLWRARLEGLSRDGAEEACHRLEHLHRGCMVISPESAS
jgi:hypothetical protein